MIPTSIASYHNYKGQVGKNETRKITRSRVVGLLDTDLSSI